MIKDENQKFTTDKEKADEPYPDDIGSVLNDYRHLLTIPEEEGTPLLTADGGMGGEGGIVVFPVPNASYEHIPRESQNTEYYIENLDQITSTTNSQGGLRKKMNPLILNHPDYDENKIYGVRYTPKKGKYAGVEVTDYFRKGRWVIYFKDKAEGLMATQFMNYLGE